MLDLLVHVIRYCKPFTRIILAYNLIEAYYVGVNTNLENGKLWVVRPVFYFWAAPGMSKLQSSHQDSSSPSIYT